MYKYFTRKHLQRIHGNNYKRWCCSLALTVCLDRQMAMKLIGCLMRPTKSGKTLQPYLEEARWAPSLPSSGDTDRAPLCRLLAGCRSPPSQALLTKVGSTSTLGACLPDGLSTVPAAATEPAKACCVAAAAGAWEADNTAGSVPYATCCEAVSAC